MVAVGEEREVGVWEGRGETVEKNSKEGGEEGKRIRERERRSGKVK